MKKRIISILLTTVLAAAFLVTGCGVQTTVGGTVKIATKPMTEQYILGDMLKLLIEAKTDLTVEMTQGVGGGTGNIQPALLKGDFDLYPEYTGTGWLFVLKKAPLADSDELLIQLRTEYEQQFDLKWVGMYGFNNTYGMLVQKDIAEKYDLHTYSDLAAVASDLTFGANYDFYERDDGYNALCEAYGFKFGKEVDMDIGLKYQALANGDVGVLSVYTTDAQLHTANAVLLEDDKHFYQTYYCGTVVRADALERFPELEGVLMLMEGILSDKDMAALNYEVEVDGRDSLDVARDYLTEKGLL